MKQTIFNASCPNCGGVLELETSWIGHKGECPYCGFKFIIKKPKRRFVSSILLVGLGVLISALGGFAYLALKTTGNKEFVREIQRPEKEIKNSFKNAKDKLVLVDCEDGSGSGFLAEMEGKKYLITNEHVLRAANGEMPRVRLLDGRTLKLGELEIAKDRDLVRIGVDADVVPFRVGAEIPNIGAGVVIYGNSAGGGVATEVTGKIQGVGPSRIEVDAMFVSGNSGSPVIDTNANVIGVATFATYYADKKDWTKKDTRFNDVRRFALRLSSVEWEKVEWDRYKGRILTAHDVGYAWSRLLPYLYAFYREVDESYLDYDEGNERNYIAKSEKESIHRAVLDVTEKYELLNDAKVDYEKLAKNRDDFVKALCGEIDDRKRRICLIDDYDIGMLKKQVALIRLLFSFNEAKLKAIGTLMGRLKDDNGISLVQNGDGELDKGLRGLCKEMSVHKDDLQRCIDKDGNASCFATNLIEGTGRLAKKDVRLGTLLLHEISRTDMGARKHLLDYWKNDKLDKTIEDVELENEMKEWMCAEYENGDAWFGLVAGNSAYDKGEYDKAIECWNRAKSTNVWAALRLGRFYYRTQDCGGAPLEMRSDKKAKDAFETVADDAFGFTSPHLKDRAKIEARYWLGHLCLFANDEECRDYPTALQIFKQLHDMDQNNPSYKFGLGVSEIRKLEKSEADVGIVVIVFEYINRYEKFDDAMNGISENDYQYWKRGKGTYYNSEIKRYKLALDAERACAEYVEEINSKMADIKREWRIAKEMIKDADKRGCDEASEYFSKNQISDVPENIDVVKKYFETAVSRCRVNFEDFERGIGEHFVEFIVADEKRHKQAIELFRKWAKERKLTKFERRIAKALSAE